MMFRQVNAQLSDIRINEGCRAHVTAGRYFLIVYENHLHFVSDRHTACKRLLNVYATPVYFDPILFSNFSTRVYAACWSGSHAAVY